MEATTTYREEHTAVGFGSAFLRQLRFLWNSRRPLLLAVALLAVLGLAGRPWTLDEKMRLFTVWPVWMFVAPMAWAFAVFHNEGPGSRHFFWSQPTGRVQHTMARLAAGVAWMWIMYAVIILAGWILGLVDGNAWQMGEIGFAAWLNFFTGPLLMYLLVCLLTVPSDYPIRWFFGILFAFPLVISLFERQLQNIEDTIRTIFAPLINEDWGLFPTSGAALVKDIDKLEQALRTMNNPAYVGHVQEFGAYWGVATPIWILVLVGLVVWVASRHPDTLPKWRGFRR